jgi:hypothetical protein
VPQWASRRLVSPIARLDISLVIWLLELEAVLFLVKRLH